MYIRAGGEERWEVKEGVDKGKNEGEGNSGSTIEFLFSERAG